MASASSCFPPPSRLSIRPAPLTGLDGALQVSRMCAIAEMLEEEALRVGAMCPEYVGAGAAPLSEEWIAHLAHVC